MNNQLIQAALNKNALYCSSYAVLTSDGMSRLFAGERMTTTMKDMKKGLVVNNETFVNVAGDNLLPFPTKVMFVDGVKKELKDEEVVKKLMEVCKDEEAASFTASTLKVCYLIYYFDSIEEWCFFYEC